MFRRDNPLVARRWFLQQCGVGLGAVALSQLLCDEGRAASPGDPLSPRAPHFAPKAKRVIFLFMAGAPSQLELFDYKPELERLDGFLPPPSLIEGYRAAFINPSSRLLGPRFSFARHGRSGTISWRPPTPGPIIIGGAVFQAAAAASAPVSTRITPGIAAAALVSTETMRACARSERRNAP